MSPRRPRSAPVPEVAPPPMRALPALAITALVVAIAISAGLVMEWAAHPGPSGEFAHCRTSARLAPRLYSGPPPTCIDPRRGYQGTVETSKGRISFVFLVGSAPRTVNNFVVLAVNGYFDGLDFFKVDDFRVQSGDPQNDGRGGPGYSLPDEKPAAGSEKWTAGSIGMARFQPGGLSGSEFFITRTAWPGGDPTTTYNHFATVTSGFDIVSQLTPSDRVLRVEIKSSPR